MSVEGEDNRQQHQRTKQKTEATSGKPENIRDPRTNSRVGDREASSRIFRQDSKNERQDIVEGSAPSETKEETANSVKRWKCRNNGHSR
jgi:hypothetical protein